MLLFCLIIILIHHSHASSSLSPVWVTSDYFQAGNYDVISDLTGPDASPSPSYNFIFTSPFDQIPSLLYGIKNYEANDYLAQ